MNSNNISSNSRRSDSDHELPNDIDIQIQDVLEKISEVDSFLKQLKERKTDLLEQYDKLKEQEMLNKAIALSKRKWDSETFPWLDEIKSILKNTFKLTSFHKQQLKTINAIISKHDVLLIAPTGGGKSLCYQLPAVFSKGITIVISPLLALMENQIWSLRKLGINAEMLCQSTDRTLNNTILKNLSDGSDESLLKVLYVTPERIANTKRFYAAMQKSYLSKKLNLIAIDEVHCCSQWGHDFRPDYKYLGTLKTMFPDCPVLGVTATATAKVINDVQKMLNIRDCLVLKAPFNRPNLYYQIMEKPPEHKAVIDLLVNLISKRYRKKSGIIYTYSIKDAETIAHDLVLREIKARPYHANLDVRGRTKTQTNWLDESIQVIVATVAFGMGIDKSNVRFVIHHTVSKSMENFYQESGRAGRDGKRAECVLLYRFADMFRITTVQFTERTGLQNAYDMINYCINSEMCRRSIISEHFTEVWTSENCNKMCDRCYNKESILPQPINVKPHCLNLYKIIKYTTNMNVRITASKLIDSWYQRGVVSLRCTDIPVPTFDRSYAEQIVAYLITNEYINEDFHMTAYSANSYMKIGKRDANLETSIDFQRARSYQLPKEINWKDIINSNSEECHINSGNNEASHFPSENNDIIFVSEEKLPTKRKKSNSKSSHTSDKSRKQKKNRLNSEGNTTTTSNGCDSSSYTSKSYLSDISTDDPSSKASDRSKKSSKKIKNIVEKEFSRRATITATPSTAASPSKIPNNTENWVNQSGDIDDGELIVFRSIEEIIEID